MRLNLIEPNASEQQDKEEHTQASLEDQRTQSNMDEQDRHQGVPRTASQGEQRGERHDVRGKLEEYVNRVGIGFSLECRPGHDVEQREGRHDGEKRGQEPLLKNFKLKCWNDRKQLGAEGEPAQTHHPREARGALAGVRRDRRFKE